jgi:hypothetical protein
MRQFRFHSWRTQPSAGGSCRYAPARLTLDGIHARQSARRGLDSEIFGRRVHHPDKAMEPQANRSRRRSCIQCCCNCSPPSVPAT